MNTIVRFFLERIFCVLIGFGIMIAGIISPRYAMLNLLTTFQRVEREIRKDNEY